MKRYNPGLLFRVGQSLGMIRYTRQKEPCQEVSIALMIAEICIAELLQNPFTTLSTGCREYGSNLMGSLKQAIGLCDEEDTEQFKSYCDILEMHLESFEALLEGDFHEFNLFSVTQVSAYDMRRLVECGEELIPEELRKLLTDKVTNDIRAAARCLAFELPTACGFHLARSLEGVALIYHEHFIGAVPTTGPQRTLGSLCQAFESNKLSVSLIGNLKHIKDHYRNPVSHPELELSIAEAVAQVPIYVSAMTEMLIEIDTQPGLAGQH